MEVGIEIKKLEMGMISEKLEMDVGVEMRKSGSRSGY